MSEYDVNIKRLLKEGKKGDIKTEIFSLSPLKTSIKKVWVTCISEDLLLILSWKYGLFQNKKRKRNTNYFLKRCYHCLNI